MLGMKRVAEGIVLSPTLFPTPTPPLDAFPLASPSSPTSQFQLPRPQAFYPPKFKSLSHISLLTCLMKDEFDPMSP